MSGLFNLEDREGSARKLAFLGILLCMAGMVTSPAMLSIGTITLIVPAFFAVPLKEQLRRFWNHKPAFFISLIFFVQVLSGIWTREMEAELWLTQVRVKAPLFFGLYALAVLSPFSRRQVRIALLVLIASTLFIGIGTVVDYFLNKEEIDQLIQTSKPLYIWLGINHIYFSIVNAFCVFAGIWLLRSRELILFKGERPLIIGMTVAVFIVMHIMTARTGLVAMYLTGMLLGAAYVIRNRKYLIGAIALVLLLGMPFVGYYGVSSFRHRVDNTWWDVSRYFAGKDPNYLSIGTRLESWKTAWSIFQKRPLLGVGMADLWADMTDQYVEDETLLCPENFVLPHNQWLRNLAGFGLLGFTVFAIGWFWPVLDRRIRKGTLFWCFWIIYSFAMLAESTVERQVGIMTLILLLMLSLDVARQPLTDPNSSES